MPHGAKKGTHAAGAVSDGVALVRSRDPLMNSHQCFSSTSPGLGVRTFRKAAEDRRPVLPKLVELLSLAELVPEIPGDWRRGLSRAFQDLIDVAQKRSVKILRPKPLERIALSPHDSVGELRILEHSVDNSCDLQRFLCGVQHSGAVHRRWHGRGRVGDNGNLLVEGLDDRNAESFVRAGAQKEVGDLVIGVQLRVCDMPGEVHVRDAQLSDELVKHGKVFLVSAIRSDQQQPRPRIEVALIGVEVPNHVLDALIRNDSADEQNIGPFIVEFPCDQIVRFDDRDARNRARPAAPRLA